MIISKRLLPIYLAVVISFFAVPSVRADMLKDMVHFDQSYIPVLALTSATADTRSIENPESDLAVL